MCFFPVDTCDSLFLSCISLFLSCISPDFVVRGPFARHALPIKYISVQASPPDFRLSSLTQKFDTADDFAGTARPLTGDQPRARAFSSHCTSKQLVAVAVMCALAGLFGQMPPSSAAAESRLSISRVASSAGAKAAATTSGGPANGTSGSLPAARRVPADAVEISREEAVSLIDGK